MYHLNAFSSHSYTNGTLPVFTPSHIHVVLSGISSSTSLASWIVLLLPQLIEQWRLKSSEGISAGFITIWFIGDIANLIGSLWADLLPGVVLLALWFCVADGLLISSYLYYRPSGTGPWPWSSTHSDSERARINKHRSSSAASDPTQPLLDRRNSASRRKSSLRPQRRDSLTSIVIAQSSSGTVLTQYVLPLLFVFAAGVFGFLFSSNEENSPQPVHEIIGLGPQLLGYMSAVLYLGARLPQLYQNYKRRSVYGLSLLFFIFSMLGNITYSGGILWYRSDREYLELYLPWLLGSLGTIFEDCAILLQFYLYADDSRGDESAILED